MAFFSSIFGNASDPEVEYKRFKKALEKNPGDQGLKSQFIKFCLMNRFTHPESARQQVGEALTVFTTIVDKEPFDLQAHYLVGKYFQEERDFRKAYGLYLGALKRFNREAVKDPAYKADHSELAYSLALNLMTLQSDPVDPEVEIGFKILRKSFRLHLKRVEMDNEISKPAPNKDRLKALSAELQKLREAEEKEQQAFQTAKEQAAEIATAQKTESAKEPQKAQGNPPVEQKPPAELKGLFSKMFNELSPESLGWSGLSASEIQKSPLPAGMGETKDSFNMQPVNEFPAQGGSFMVFHENQWEDPFTPSELGAKGFLKPATWVCRKGSQQVVQAYEVPDLQAHLKK